MKHLVNLFKLIELTRSQVQYGYILSGIKRGDLSNLAEHHYLVTFIAWQLARFLEKSGVKIDIRKVLEFSMIHDLGELFGGDISMPYGKINPKAREYAKMFEEENQIFLSKFFGDDEEHFQQISKEILNAYSLEAVIAKIADYMELNHYKQYVRAFSKEKDLALIEPKMLAMISKVEDQLAKEKITEFIQYWLHNLEGKEVLDILSEDK